MERPRRLLLLALVCCLFTGTASADSFSINGSFSFTDNFGIYSWDVNFGGADFGFSGELAYGDRATILATGSFVDSIDITDYEPPSFSLDGTDSSIGELDGMAGPVSGYLNYSLTYNPSFNGTLSGVPVTFSGKVSGSVCESVPGGCQGGAELWAVNLAGSGTANIDQYSNGPGGPEFVGSVQVDDAQGAATSTYPASEPGSSLLVSVVLIGLAGSLLHRRWRTNLSGGH